MLTDLSDEDIKTLENFFCGPTNKGIFLQAAQRFAAAVVNLIAQPYGLEMFNQYLKQNGYGALPNKNDAIIRKLNEIITKYADEDYEDVLQKITTIINELNDKAEANYINKVPLDSTTEDLENTLRDANLLDPITHEPIKYPIELITSAGKRMYDAKSLLTWVQTKSAENPTAIVLDPMREAIKTKNIIMLPETLTHILEILDSFKGKTSNPSM